MKEDGTAGGGCLKWHPGGKRDRIRFRRCYLMTSVHEHQLQLCTEGSAADGGLSQDIERSNKNHVLKRSVTSPNKMLLSSPGLVLWLSKAMVDTRLRSCSA